MSERLRAYVVDDEAGALKQVVQSLKATGRVEVVGTASGAETALAEIPALGVEALFLDIHMPGMNGFELLERLTTSVPPAARPLVVFVTAYDAHALEAFDASAIDYLLKPVKRERLERTLDRLDRRRGDAGDAGTQDVLEKLARHYLSSQPTVYAERISVDLGQQRSQLVEVAKVTHFVAQGKATLAVTAAGRHLVDHALGALEERLDPRQFVRIHRSAIVNMSWVGEVQPDLGGRLLVRLKDAARTELQVARERARTFKERLVL